MCGKQIIGLLFIVMIGMLWCCGGANAAIVNRGELIFQRFGVAEGLSQVSILSIAEDRDGFLWVGTEDGLNRFDGVRFETYFHDAKNPNSLLSSYIQTAIPLIDGSVLVVNGGGIDRVFPATRHVEHLVQRHEKNALRLSADVNDATRDEQGNVWLADDFGLLFFNFATAQFTRFPIWPSTPERPIWHQAVTSLAVTAQGQLYVSSLGGVRIFDPSAQRFYDELPAWLAALPFSARVLHIRRGQHGELFIADQQRLHTLYPSQQRAQSQLYSELGLSDVPQAILEDKSGGFWLATGRGLFYRAPGQTQVQHFRQRSELNDSLPDNMLTELLLDRHDNIWVGSYSNGMAKLSSNALNVRYWMPPADLTSNTTLSVAKVTNWNEETLAFVSGQGWISLLDVKRGTITPFSATPAIDFNAKPQPFVSGLVRTQNAMWVSTYNGLYRQTLNGKFQRFVVPAAAGQLNSQTWSDIALDDQGVPWFLNPHSGLFRYNEKNNTIERMTENQLGLFNKTTIPFRLKHVPGGFWIGTTANQLHYWPQSGGALKTVTLRCAGVERVFDILSAADDILWLASNVGLLQFDIKRQHCRDINAEWGLPSTVSNAVINDVADRLWVSTNRGVVLYDIEKKIANVFGINDGFHHGEFNAYAVTKVLDRIVFGSPRGVVIFDPLSQQWSSPSPNVTIHSLHINSEPIHFSSTDTPLLLSHTQNQLSMSFAATNLSAATEYEYRYQLDGSSHPQWIAVNSINRSAQFNALAPGNYHFLVQARRPFSEWGETQRLSFSIAPAWWKSRWAWGIYLLLFSLCFVIAWRWRTRYLHRRNLVLQRAVDQRTQQIESLLKQRTRLFANVSHELRTPLTLITGPVSDLLHEKLPDLAHKKLVLIHQNSQRLHELVDQVLAITQLQDDSAAPLPKQMIALKPHLLALLESYEVIARHGQLQLTWGPIDDIDVMASADLPEVVFGNLISNAIKYTNPGGAIHVSLRFNADSDSVCFEIRDNGIGMNETELQQIFEPFYRAQHEDRKNALLPHSSGLGLTHVKEFVAQHQGQILVQSEEGLGSIFFVHLPAQSLVQTPDAERTQPELEDSGERASVLIVEDNVSLNDYLQSLLAPTYHCWVAFNGAEAERLAIDHTPDLIISDIRLPTMDGLTLCQHLKSDLRTSHIPFIVLTALADSDSKLTALKLQADDFIAKPFDATELKLKVNNLIQRQSQRQPGPLVVECVEPALIRDELLMSPVDKKFMQQLHQLFEDNLSNTEFELDLISKRLYLSKKQLQRKIKALTGLSPMEYLRHYRIQQACQLLSQGRTISDVCYSVGFSSQSYFTTCFKQQTGETPKNWQQLQRAGSAM